MNRKLCIVLQTAKPADITLSNLSWLQAGAPPGTKLVFHTLHLPRLDASKEDGTLAHATISRRSHVAQLNAAGRHLARRHGFQVGTDQSFVSCLQFASCHQMPVACGGVEYCWAAFGMTARLPDGGCLSS